MTSNQMPSFEVSYDVYRWVSAELQFKSMYKLYDT